MPLLQRKIENSIAYGAQELYQDSQQSEILPNIGFAGKVGTVAQITMLASIAHELFSSVLEETKKLSDRIQKVASRTNVITGIVDGTITSFPDDACQQIVVAQNNDLLCKQTLPNTIKARYNAVQPMPALHEIDVFLGAKQAMKVGKTAEQYSNPQIFFTRWVADQEKKIGKSKDERVHKKAEKRARLQRYESSFNAGNGEVSHERQKKKSADWRER